MRQTRVACGLLWLAAAAVAGTFDDLHRAESAANPPDVKYVLKTSTGQTTFRPGEKIPITLEFSSPWPAKYRLDAAAYDRGGRLYFDHYFADREDAVDPLADYYDSGTMPLIGGGPRSIPVLTTEPFRINLVLNDWYRFDKPGRYRLFVKSRRLSRERLPGESAESPIVVLAAVSSILEIEITQPDPAWEAAKRAELQSVLENLGGQFSQARPSAGEELGYLGTPGAVRLMLDRMRQNPRFTDAFGLIRSPHRALVVAELDQFIDDPATAVTNWTLRLRTLFDWVERHPRPNSLSTPGKTAPAAVSREMGAREEIFPEAVHARAVALIPVCARKSEAARDVCIQTIAAIAREDVRAAGLIPLENYGMSRAELIARFATIPEKQQTELLKEKWGLIRGKEMLPALRAIVEHAPPEKLDGDGQYRFWRGPCNLAEQALDRLSQLAPEEGRRILLQDIARAAPRFPRMAVHELEAQDVPEADAALAANLKAHPAPAMPLVARFGTAAILDAVRDACTGGVCGTELMAYFIRVGADEGKDPTALRGALTGLFGNPAENVWNAQLERVALSLLNDADPRIAIQGASLLSAHGSAAVEPALWKRLEAWSNQWRGHAQELKSHPITGFNPNEAQSRLGDALFGAINGAKSWVTDDVRRRRLLALCVDDVCREAWSRPLPETVKVGAADSSPIYGRVFNAGQYRSQSLAALETKMTQFPAGTTFHWCPSVDRDAFVPAQRQELFDALARFTAAHAMRMEPYDEEACRFH